MGRKTVLDARGKKISSTHLLGELSSRRGSAGADLGAYAVRGEDSRRVLEDSGDARVHNLVALMRPGDIRLVIKRSRKK